MRDIKVKWSVALSAGLLSLMISGSALAQPFLGKNPFPLIGTIPFPPILKNSFPPIGKNPFPPIGKNPPPRLGSPARTYDQTGPWWAKLPRPLLGMAYSPEPSDYGDPANTCPFPNSCKYFDDDFFNADFPLLWGSSGRDDQKTIQDSLNMNFLHLYNFGVCRNHIPFLDYAQSLGISVMIPISNYFVKSGTDPNRTADIQALLNEIYEGGKTPHPAAALWDIGNEYDISGVSAADVASVVKIIVNYENTLGITDANKLLFTSPISFGTFGRPNAPGIVKLQELQTAFSAAGLEDIWYSRFVASINPFNDGPFMANFLKVTYPDNMSSGGTTLPLFFSEFGQSAVNAGQLLGGDCSTQALQDAAQAKYETTQITDVLPFAKISNGYFYGFAIFQWQNEFFKGGAEAQWGVVEQSGAPTANGTISGGECGIPSNTFTYPVDPLVQKPNFSVIDNLIK
jgi:hypothetical protein